MTPERQRQRSQGALTGLAMMLAFLVAVVAVNRVTEGEQKVAAGLAIFDGDTVQHAGNTYRLLGFDAPERGDRAFCDREREQAETTALRLKELIAGGEPQLERTACPCATGTEGTSSCNAGRFCATLKVDGRDVGDILIAEGLAHRFVCGDTSCPPRRPWC